MRSLRFIVRILLSVRTEWVSYFGHLFNPRWNNIKVIYVYNMTSRQTICRLGSPGSDSDRQITYGNGMVWTYENCCEHNSHTLFKQSCRPKCMAYWLCLSYIIFHFENTRHSNFTDQFWCDTLRNEITLQISIDRCHQTFCQSGHLVNRFGRSLKQMIVMRMKKAKWSNFRTMLPKCKSV